VTARLHLPLGKKRYGSERLLDDYAERGIQTWASPIDLVRLLLIRRDPKPIDPEHWSETPKVLDLLVPGFDRLTAENGATIPPANEAILRLSLRPTPFAGVAIVEHSGPKIIAELHDRTIGAYSAQFNAIAANILGAQQSDFSSSTAAPLLNGRSLTFKYSVTARVIRAAIGSNLDIGAFENVVGLSVNEIGERLGFVKSAHFTRLFCNLARVCPREFRSMSRLAQSTLRPVHHFSNRTDW
jgi:AraC-like DNA-binding protein